MKKILSTLFAATLLASGAQASEPVKSAATINADPALWVVKDADTTIYLFGTIHLMKPEVQWFDGGVKAAYDASSEIVMEMVEPEPSVAQRAVQKFAIDPDGPALSKKLSAKQLRAYTKAMEGLNLPAASFEQFEPWFVATMLGIMPLQKYGFSPEAGVEKVIGAAAKRDGKKVSGLETMEQQLSFFDTLPEALQIKLLDETIKGLPGFGKQINGMLASWKVGKTDKLASALNKAMKETPEISKVLLKDRNARWTDWVAKRMDQPGTIFIAVGAGHLAGKDSVQSMLKARNITVTRIAS
jgi:uncharacterized protein